MKLRLHITLTTTSDEFLHFTDTWLMYSQLKLLHLPVWRQNCAFLCDIIPPRPPQISPSVVVTVTEALVLSPLLVDRGHITESIHIRLHVCYNLSLSQQLYQANWLITGLPAVIFLLTRPLNLLCKSRCNSHVGDMGNESNCSVDTPHLMSTIIK